MIRSHSGQISPLSLHAGSEIALSWSPMRLKILHWQPEFHNWSAAGDLLCYIVFHTTIITQTIALIFSQIDKIKFKAARQLVTFYLSVALEV